MSASRGQGTVRKYLVGTIDRWNNAKKAEERDRVKHDSFRGAIKEVAEKTA